MDMFLFIKSDEMFDVCVKLQMKGTEHKEVHAHHEELQARLTDLCHVKL